MHLLNEELARAQQRERLEAAHQAKHAYRARLAHRAERAARRAQRAARRADRAAHRARLALARQL